MEDFDDFEDNLIVEDDALDYILYEEIQKEDRKGKGQNTGCSVLFLIFGIAVTAITFGFIRIAQAVL